MARKSLNLGRYQLRYDKNSRPYYVERKSNKRVSADAVGEYLNQNRQRSKEAAKKQWRTEKGQFVSKADQKMVTSYMRKKFPKMTKEDVKKSVRKWNRKELQDNVRLALGLPPLTEIFYVYNAEGRQRTMLSELYSLGKKYDVSFVLKGKMVSWVVFKTSLYQLGAQLALEYEEESGATCYAVGMDIRLDYAGAFEWKGDGEMVTSDGVKLFKK